MSVYATEADEGLFESDESFAEDTEADEVLDEARSRVYNRRVPTVRPPLYQPPSPQGGSGPVTVALVDAKIETVRAALSKMIADTNAAVRAVDNKAIRLANDQSRHRKAVNAKIKNVQRDLAQTRELAAVLPLLTSQTSRALSTPVANLNAGDRVMLDSGDRLTQLLPLLLLGGMGGSSEGESGSSGSLFGSSDSLLPLVLIMSLGRS